MSGLLRAGFARLVRDRLFRLMTAAFAVWGAVVAKTMEEQPLEFQLFQYAPLVGLALAVFVSLFLGEEYSSGAIRNKIIAGHSRKAVYLANLAVSAAAGAALCAAYTAAFLAVGRARGGELELPAGTAAMLVLAGILAAAAHAAVLTLLAMVNQNKAGNVVVSMLLVLAAFFVCAPLHLALCEPEMYDRYVAVNEQGVPTQVSREPNPNYLEEPARGVCRFVIDLLPAGQEIQLASDLEDGRLLSEDGEGFPWRWPAFSAALTAGATAAGAAAFGRKDIR